MGCLKALKPLKQPRNNAVPFAVTSYLLKDKEMKTSQVFTRAKKKLSNGRDDHGKQTYICYAIDRTKCSIEDKDKATAIIMNLLEGCYTFGNWLEIVQGIENDRYGEKMQETRHAWLDHLIEHYESIGD